MSNVVVDFLSGGNTINNDIANAVYDQQARVYEAEKNVSVESGYMTEAQAQSEYESNLKTNEKDRKAEISRINGVTTTNIALNLGTIAISAVGAVGAVKGAGKVVEAGGKAATKEVYRTIMTEAGEVTEKTTKSVVRDAAKNAGKFVKSPGFSAKAFLNESNKVTLKTIGKGVWQNTRALGAGSLNLMHSTGAKAGAHLAAGNLGAAAVYSGIVASPVIASQIYTRSRSNKITSELNDTLTVLNAATDYLAKNYDEIKEGKGEIYKDWLEGYTAGCEDLQQQLASGKITQAEYDEQYEGFIQYSKERLDNAYSEYPEMGKRIVTDGVAAYMTGDMIDHKIDPDVPTTHSDYVKEHITGEDYEEYYQSAKQSYEENKELDKGSEFANFFANIHDAIIHYAPVAAYLEAAVGKAVDKGLELIDDYIPGYDHNEKYEHQSISDIAHAISQEADANFEARQAIDDRKDEVIQVADAAAAIQPKAELAQTSATDVNESVPAYGC